MGPTVAGSTMFCMALLHMICKTINWCSDSPILSPSVMLRLPDDEGPASQKHAPQMLMRPICPIHPLRILHI